MVNANRKQGLETPFDFTAKAKQAKAAKTCAWPDCTEHGEFRTAKSPRAISDHIWLCQEHIREHNKAWNYFDGMTDDEVENTVRSSTVWERPTWKLGTNTHKTGQKGFAGQTVRDPFGFFDDEDQHTSEHVYRAFPPGSPEAKAYATLDLAPPISLDEVKARYKKLVKKHHPDANGGSKEAEEMFKEISFAYQIVVKHLQG